MKKDMLDRLPLDDFFLLNISTFENLFFREFNYIDAHSVYTVALRYVIPFFLTEMKKKMMRVKTVEKMVEMRVIHKFQSR
jgi:hypothetical protein